MQHQKFKNSNDERRSMNTADGDVAVLTNNIKHAFNSSEQARLVDIPSVNGTHTTDEEVQSPLVDKRGDDVSAPGSAVNLRAISATLNEDHHSERLKIGAAGDDKKQKIKHLDEAVTDQLDDTVDLEELLVNPNISESGDVGENIARQVNTYSLQASESLFGTTIIEPGKIGILNHNGTIQIAKAGRWKKMNPRADWVRIASLTESPIVHETLTIVRVPKGKYSLSFDNGRPVILKEGIHARNTRLFAHREFQDVNQKHIKHGTINILFVPSGEYALVIEKNLPKVLVSGRYVIDSNFFTVVSFVTVNQPHITHLTLHIVRVPKGKVALITENSKPKLLPEGTHSFNSQVFAYVKMEDVNAGSIIHGTITRFRVRQGEIALCWWDNKPVFIETPDFYEMDSPNFTFVKCVASSEKEIILGSRKRIIVYDGEVGLSYKNGKLDILQPKTHVFDDAERIFTGFLSTRQQSLFLTDVESKETFLRCDTKDFVEIGLRAAVFYKICDPEKCLLMVGNSDAMAKLIRETSIATLQAIMRSTALNQVAQSKSVHATSSEHYGTAAPGNVPSAPMFFDKVHDEFISKLHDTFKKAYGVEVNNIRIESFKIMNHELSENISKQAIITAQTETKLANLEGQREIATAEMERDAAVTRIKSQAAAAQLATDVQARNNALVSDAQAKATASKIVAQGEAEALIIKAEAEARLIIIKAEAEAKAIEMRAAAERKQAEEMSATPLGAQLALLNVQSQMVTRSLAGVQKIIYLPSNANLAEAPLQMFGLPSLGVPALDSLSNKSA